MDAEDFIGKIVGCIIFLLSPIFWIIEYLYSFILKVFNIAYEVVTNFFGRLIAFLVIILILCFLGIKGGEAVNLIKFIGF